MTKRVTVVVAAALLGCATPNQPMGMTGGFREMRLNERSWSVAFAGNGFTHREAVRTYAVRRAAEITLWSGYQFFVVTDKAVNVDTDLTGSSTSCYGNANGVDCHSRGPMLINKPTADLTFTMLTAAEAAKLPPTVMAYDANIVASQFAWR